MQNLFISAGLTGVQAEILDFLLKNGEEKASEIAKKINRPRGVVYNSLESLLLLELAEKTEKRGQVARFKPCHPGKLEKLFEEKEKGLKQEKKALLTALPDLISSYNLASNKPGVKFFEGEEGLKQALYDTLASKTEIYTFADIKAIEDNLKEINEEYARRREKSGIKKKLIVEDNEFNRNFFRNFSSETTLVRYIPEGLYPFSSGMQIYDDKISYQTLAPENKIAVIIEDKNIYLLNKAFFEIFWNKVAKD
jgi:HTH-type transcriptional regulator, sugar sensing transcriptional regulator